MGNTASTALDFIEELNKQRNYDSAMAELQNSTEVKMRKLQQAKKETTNACYTNILGKFLQASTPSIMGHTPNVQDLDKVVNDYVARRTDGQDSTYYVKEALKRNPQNTALKNIIESVEKIIRDKYLEKEILPDTIEDKDLTTEVTPDIDEKLDKVIKDNDLDSLSEIIKDNVRNSAIAEVEAAKKEKEERKNLESELANDESIDSVETLERVLTTRGINQTSLYTPSLFNAVMINAFNHADTDVGEFSECVDMSAFEESAFSKIKTKMSERKEAKAKGTMNKRAAGITLYAQSIYKEVFGMFKSEVSPIYPQKVRDDFMDALKGQKKELSVKLPDVDTTLKSIDAIRKAVTPMLKGENSKPSDVKHWVYRKQMKKYSATEAASLFMSCYAKISKKFEKPDVDGFAEKYTKMANRAASMKTNPNEVNAVYTAVEGLIEADMSEYIVCVDVVKMFTKYATSVIKHANKTVVKEAAFNDAITEYTLLNISKALRLEDFSRSNLDKIIHEYASN